MFDKRYPRKIKKKKKNSTNARRQANRYQQTMSTVYAIYRIKACNALHPDFCLSRIFFLSWKLFIFVHMYDLAFNHKSMTLKILFTQIPCPANSEVQWRLSASQLHESMLECLAWLKASFKNCLFQVRQSTRIRKRVFYSHKTLST